MPAATTTPAPVSAPQVGAGAPAVVEDASETILVHILEDGFSAHGQVWYRGQEIEYVKNETVYKDTLDRDGNSWLDLDPRGQMRRYGRVYFAPGPWPGVEYEDENSREAELKRGKKPRALAPVSAGRR